MKPLSYSALVALLLTGSCAGNGISNQKETLAMATQTSSQKIPDAALVTELIKELFERTDRHDWQGVRATLADSVYVDYTALGGAAGFRQPEEITANWAQLLPGFDRHVHQVHNVVPWVAGSYATATLDAIATHYLDGRDWTVFVGYDVEFVRTDRTWKIARIDLSLYDQAGDATLPQQAQERVQKRAKGPQRSAAAPDPARTAVVEAFFDALERQDLDGVLSSFTADATQLMPLAPENFPSSLNGQEALRAQYQGVMSYKQTYERTYFATPNPDEYLVRYQGHITIPEGQPYNNAYVGIFRLAGDKIAHFTEYFNPSILLNGWPGLRPAHYSVHAAGASPASGVTLEKVQFNSQGAGLTGHLFRPPGFAEGQLYPAVVVTGSWTSVKEQMPDEYASLLAEQGFMALTFDFTGFGESEGQPRQVEDFRLKMADIKAATDFLVGQPGVDGDRLAGVGVCASAGYMAHAAAQDDRLGRLVLVAPWLHNAEIARMIYDQRPGGTDGLLATAQSAQEKYAATGEMDYVLAASELDPLSAMYVPQNAFDYYLNPAKAAGRVYDNRFAVSSWEPWLTFDGISAGSQVKQPVFIVHSESGAVPQGTQDFYAQLEGEKEIVWLNEYNQQQFYHEPEAVHAAISRVAAYLED